MVQPKQPIPAYTGPDTVGKYLFAQPQVKTFPDMSANYQQTVLVPQQEAQKAQEAADEAARQALVQYTAPAPIVYSGGSQAAIAYAKGLVDPDQWQCLYNLWNRESGWNPSAVNASSGAAGIAQSLGHGYVPLGDYASQINWGVAYIQQTYGTPCNAWLHSQQFNWY